MKRLLFITLLVVFLSGCGGNKSSVEFETDPRKKSVKDSYDLMASIVTEIEAKRDDYIYAMDDEKDMIREHGYHNSEALVYKLNAGGVDKKVEHLENKRNPLISHKRDFNAVVSENIVNIGGNKEVTYSIMIHHLESGNERAIFECDEELFVNSDISMNFNLYAWHPYTNLLVLTGNEGKENNVYLADFIFDKEDHYIKYRITRLTEYEESYSLMNYNWCFDGDRFTFTKYDGSNYEVYEYNVIEQTLKQISSSDEIVSFVYDNYRQQKGFAVARKAGRYVPVFVDRIKDCEISETKALVAEGFSKPFIFGSFCMYEEKLGFYAADEKDTSLIGFYDYDDSFYQSTKVRWDYNGNSGYPVQLLSPTWYLDKFLIFYDGKSVSYIDSEQRYTGNGELVVSSIKKLHGDLVNSLQELQPGIMMYTYREMTKFQTETFNLKIIEKTLTPPLEVRLYEVEYDDFMTTEENKGQLKMKRKKKSRVSSFDATLGVRDGNYLLEFKSREAFEKARSGARICTGWSTDIKQRKINANYRIPENPGDITFKAPKIVN